MTVRTFTIDLLTISPLNVRLNAEDAEATDALEASIEAHGLLFPLVVHPLEDGRFGVLAGGRRLRAIRRLIESGRLPAGWSIEAVIREDEPAQITELSLAENLLRRGLRPYEINAAVLRAAEQGASPAEIAARCGQRERWALQQLRLGKLAPEIFNAYAEGQLSEDLAQAYAATEDHALQLAAWEALRDTPSWHHTPAAVRRCFKLDDAELGRLLAFVGAEIYHAAGGRFEFDLFCEDPAARGRVVDEDKLRELAENKLAHLRGLARVATGDRDLRFATQPPQRHGHDDAGLRIVDLPIDGEIAPFTLPEGDVVATLRIEDNGAARLALWWSSRAAQVAGTRQPGQPAPTPRPAVLDAAGFDRYSSTAQVARSAVREEHGLTAEGLNAIRSLRRALLRSLLIADAARGGTLGRDYFVWAQLRMELTDDRHHKAGLRSLASEWHYGANEESEFARGFAAATAAHAAFGQMLEELETHPAFALPDQVEALRAFLEESEVFRSQAGAALAGIALLRSAGADGFRMPVHDALAAAAGGDDATLRTAWTPDVAFFGLFPKMARLGIAQQFVDPASFASWPKLADAPLSAACAALFDGESLSPGPARDAATRWVHPLVSFEAEPPPAEPAAAEQPRRKRARA